MLPFWRIVPLTPGSYLTCLQNAISAQLALLDIPFVLQALHVLMAEWKHVLTGNLAMRE